jgi:hypothetical protein
LRNQRLSWDPIHPKEEKETTNGGGKARRRAGRRNPEGSKVEAEGGEKPHLVASTGGKDYILKEQGLDLKEWRRWKVTTVKV